MKLKLSSVQSKLIKVNNNPRVLSLYILNNFQIKDCLLDTLMKEAFQQASFLDQRDRSFVFSLVYGVIRWQLNLDYMIGQLSQTPFSKISIPVCNILRMGLFQIEFMDRIPNHAAVNASCELTRIFAPNYLTRFVNGILRQAIRSKGSIQWPDESKNRVKAISIQYAHPEWLVKRWINHWGIDHTKALCIAGNVIPDIVLRTNTLKISQKDLIRQLKTDVKELKPSLHAPDGICISHIRTPLDHMESFKKGYFQVQDEAAQLIGLMLSAQQGESILDACAGRGGKTAHIAQCMNNKGTITAVDQSPQKLETLASEMKRLGISIVKKIQHQWKTPLKSVYFDRILLDAPCSGLGVIRRHPDMKWKKTESYISRHKTIQSQLLEMVSIHLKPGGQMVYAVCSLEPEETTMIVDHFLSNHFDFSIVKQFNPIIDPFLSDEGYLITFPDKHHMDGFFAVCLQKMGTPTT
jgi:16S rRNA (cytosine967-C5)-methyltransferase